MGQSFTTDVRWWQYQSFAVKASQSVVELHRDELWISSKRSAFSINNKNKNNNFRDRKCKWKFYSAHYIVHFIVVSRVEHTVIESNRVIVVVSFGYVLV